MSYTPTEWEPTDVVTATRMNTLEQVVGDMNMSYTPNTWSDGDILSAEKMNALEQAVASGGGSSDFSTAQVTFICNASNLVSIAIAVAEEANPPFLPAARTSVGYELGNGDEITATAILYKGSCWCFFDGASSISGTGNVEIDFYNANITGDCTITIS